MKLCKTQTNLYYYHCPYNIYLVLVLENQRRRVKTRYVTIESERMDDGQKTRDKKILRADLL